MSQDTSSLNEIFEETTEDGHIVSFYTEPSEVYPIHRNNSLNKIYKIYNRRNSQPSSQHNSTLLDISQGNIYEESSSPHNISQQPSPITTLSFEGELEHPLEGELEEDLQEELEKESEEEFDKDLEEELEGERGSF